MLEKIKSLAKTYAAEMIAIRQHLHAHPELSYQEFETSRFVQSKLRAWGIDCQIMATTGVVGLIEGRNPQSRVMALRADMDALPIVEANDISYKSTNEGVMHACGHDVHTTCLLGAAKILKDTQADWEGTVKLVFQPGEEKNPGGASLMIKDGVLENPRPQGIFGLHVHPGLAVGRLSFREGMSMASADELYITLKAKGGHAAAPHITIDLIVAASQLVLNLQQIISRNNNPINPSVLSICAFNGGSSTNVIPSEVQLKGTLRCFDETWRKQAHQLIENQCKAVALSTGATVDLHIDIGYPVVYNDSALTKAGRQLADAFVGADKVESTELRLGSEDFGYYSREIPACFYRLGVRNEALGITSAVHTPTFNIDESAIEIGMGMMAWLGATAK
jgi:amidohydrolase